MLQCIRGSDLHQKATKLKKAVLKAQIIFVMLLADNNIPRATAEKLFLVINEFLTNSKIAKVYSSRQNKTACIVTNTVPPDVKKILLIN